MKTSYKSKRLIAGMIFSFLTVTGTYNAIVINSESSISGVDAKLTKRLDEVYGAVSSKREVAATIQWHKLSSKQAAIQKEMIPRFEDKSVPSESKSEPTAEVVQAAVQEDLNLTLSQVINPKIWSQGINSSQFSGNLTTNAGVIESLNVSLPNGKSLSISFSEMSGNVFQYDLDGNVYNGMMYQKDATTYAVNLTDGPLAETQLTFAGEPSVEQDMQNEDNQRLMAETMDNEAGKANAVAVTDDQQLQEQALQQDSQEPQVTPQLDEQPNFDPYAQGGPATQDQMYQEQAQLENGEQNQMAM